MPHRRRRSRLARLGNLALTLAAVGGVLCIVAVIAAAVFHVSLIMFKTGSMTPAIPAGSLALVREVPAGEVRAGDVVTVDRENALPITHRVVSAVPQPGGTTALTLRGDANPQNDPEPYRVRTVRLVIASVPGAAQVVVLASNPFVLGAVTVGASVLVGWAFWPRRRDDDELAGGDPAHGEPMPVAGGASQGTRILSLFLVAALPFMGTLVHPSGARADTTETVVSSRYLTLTSLADSDDMSALRPERPVRWVVGVAAHPPDPAPISIGLSATGALAAAGGLRVSVLACTQRWIGGRCPGVRLRMLDEQRLTRAIAGAGADGIRLLGTMPSSEQRWLAVDVTLPAGWSPGSSAALRIHVWGAGDSAETPGRSAQLSATGSAVSGGVFALAGGAVLVGLMLAAAARRRRRPSALQAGERGR
ncbi:signal peptidase I [Leifsonia sp. NPDC058292]|uniref:signal peptidase I n=1 Tax=Leifsonia sp. NPDC058292 TaxID=3346428 RepID=UPI0036DE69AD